MKVVVGQNTIVKKITVGTPLRVGSAANGSLTGLDDVNKVWTTGSSEHDEIIKINATNNNFFIT